MFSALHTDSACCDSSSCAVLKTTSMDKQRHVCATKESLLVDRLLSARKKRDKTQETMVNFEVSASGCMLRLNCKPSRDIAALIR